jgi:hypothetical protein
MGVYPWPSLTMQDHPSKHQHPSPTGSCFPGDNRRPQTMRCQPCCSHSGSWLVYTWQKLEELPISPLRMSSFHVFFLLILVSSLLGEPQALYYDSCMHTSWAGGVVRKILVFHTYNYCAGTVVRSCIHNHTVTGTMRETKSLRPFLQEAGSLLCSQTQER